MPRMATKPNKELTIAEEPIYKKGWRPALAWAYVTIVIFDFLIAPLIMMAFFGAVQIPILPQGLTGSEIIEIIKALPEPVYHQWVPLTLQAGGFFHIAMGGMIGVGSWTRGVEKQKRVEAGVYLD